MIAADFFDILLLPTGDCEGVGDVSEEEAEVSPAKQDGKRGRGSGGGGASGGRGGRGGGSKSVKSVSAGSNIGRSVARSGKGKRYCRGCQPFKPVDQFALNQSTVQAGPRELLQDRQAPESD